jgi:hypothetical protein
MPDLSALLASLLVLAMVVVLLQFALGTQRNIRRGNELLRWLQGGLPVMGARTRLRWLGSSAVVLGIVDPKSPFREAEVLVVLEPRDIRFLWAWGRSRRRRDFLIFRTRLIHAPAFEVEVGQLQGWTGQDRLRQLDAEAWEKADWELPEVQVRHSRGADLETVNRAWRELESCTAGVWRLSIRREPPHLEVHVRPLEAHPAVRMFEVVHDLGVAALDRG